MEWGWMLLEKMRQRLITLAFAGSIGMTFVILACMLPESKGWSPFFVVLFYLLSPIPTLIARRYAENSGAASNPCLELAIFLTMGCAVSSFALPIVLERTSMIHPAACYLTLAGNIVVYLTIIGFFIAFDQDDSDYSMW
ncbi:hypothetical protein QAD02_005931 [Eretmocerus hayati]|uniref:Uncharacterized protein n=1 Tax=Eretmocerus hayati TaxID=131215 RepID=A0ACC2MZN9_9HYME|nr:hypothetical protein QAD02_005931 [Eretmocerus hayati]